MMRGTVLLSAVLWLSLLAGATSNRQLKPGTILPVSLDRTLDTAKIHDGQRISLAVMQDVPQSSIKRRSHVFAHVVSVTRSAGAAAELGLRFDEIEEHGKRIPLVASLRALASWMEVEQAKVPEESMDRGITAETATTAQVGGEQVYRGGGPVASGTEAVAIPTPYGALGRPRSNAERGCRGDAGQDGPQALWLFSTDACGVYGFSDLHIVHAGKSNPLGTIVLSDDSGRLKLQGGTGMLLRVE